MGILDDLTPKKPVEPCRAIQAALELEPNDARILLDAYQDERWSPTGLSNALRARGVTIAADTIRVHKRNQCRCSKI
jgi:hypothetical protein